MTTDFVIDTNFFISVNQLSEKLWINKLNAVKQENEDISFYVSGQIVGEMPFLKNDRQEFEDVVHVDKVSPIDIETLKKAMGVKNPAQDNDLSLLYLANGHANAGTETWLVTDDFKLVENAQHFNEKVKILTPGAFLLKMSTMTGDAALKRYFKSMEKKVTDYSINYILSRKDIYPAAKKLSWLIDRTAALVGAGDTAIEAAVGCEVGMDLVKQRSHIVGDDLDESMVAKLQVADVYVSSGLVLDENVARTLESIQDYLDNLKAHVAVLASTKQKILDEDLAGAEETVRQLDSDLVDDIITARFEYKDDYPLLYVLTAIQLYRIVFFKAYIALLRSEMQEALTGFTNAAYWATQARQDAAVLNTVYMKAMIFFFNFNDIPDFYIKAIDHFEHARVLAELAGNAELQIKCLVAKAIASYEVERVDDAQDFIKMVKGISMEHPDAALIAFSELADYFLVFGKPEYSVFLYGEALEAAVVTGEEAKTRGLVEKMNKSYIIAGMQMASISRGGVKVDSLIDQSFDIVDKDKIDQYNDEIMKLAQFNSLMHEPFPIAYKDWTAFQKADDRLKKEFEIVEVEEMEGKNRVTVYDHDLGLFAFVVPKLLELAGPPESYTIRLAKSASIKTRQVTGELFDEKLIRALIYVKSGKDIDIQRSIPQFLKLA
jgi:hypothetical protein